MLKTVAAFLNSQGGTLVIGVEDDGTISGLHYDLDLLDGSRDRFEQLLTQLVSNSIGAGIAPLTASLSQAVDESENELTWSGRRNRCS